MQQAYTNLYALQTDVTSQTNGDPAFGEHSGVLCHSATLDPDKRKTNNATLCCSLAKY